MGNVNTSSQAIKDAMDICIKALEILRTTNTKLRGKYIDAGSNWNDTKYQQLGDIVSMCGSSFDKAMRDLDACLVPLSNMIKFVHEYEEINISGSIPSASSGISRVSDRHTPINNGTWSGERGNSMWQPTDEAVLNDLHFYGNGATGIEYHNGYADFTPVQVYECTLHSQLYYRNNNYQFVECTLELRDYLRSHPNSDLISYFDDEQLSAITRGHDNIPCYTWHHDVQAGRMQLIPTSIHNSCPHEGGQSIWGGGVTNR